MKKIRIMMLIVVIIIITILITLIYIQKNPTIVDSPASNSGVDRETNDQIVRVKNRIDFYCVETCVNKYFSCFTEEGQEKVLYNILDKEYTSSKQLTENNIANIVQKFQEAVRINITDMYVNDKEGGISVYVVEGIIKGNSSGNSTNFKLIVKLDKTNRVFWVLPQDYIQEKYKNIEEGTSLKIDVSEAIQKNNYNMYDYKNVADVDYAEDLFARYKSELMFNRELAYRELEKEYSNKKFGSYDEFEKYVKNNLKDIVPGKLDKYQKTLENGYTQYVLVDTKRKKLYLPRNCANEIRGHS